MGSMFTKVCRLVTASTLSLGLCIGLSFTAIAKDIPAIAAASNIKFALDEISTQFTEQTGKKVRISYGSSGNFVAQIRNGAPFELFLSADERYIKQLNSLGVIDNDGELYAYGRLALAASKRSPLQLDDELLGLKELLAKNGVKRFAIANPDHAPYGVRAQEVLEKFSLWQPIQQQLILGENVSQAAQFAISGSTQGGIVALSLAVSKPFQQRANYVVIPQQYHSPIKQRMVLTPKAQSTAKAFYAYILSADARAVFERYGFGLPVLDTDAVMAPINAPMTVTGGQ